MERWRNTRDPIAALPMLCLSLSLQVAVLADAGPEAPLGPDDWERGRPRDVEERAAFEIPAKSKLKEAFPQCYDVQPRGCAVEDFRVGLGQVGHEGGGDEAEEGELEAMVMLD